MTRVVNSGKAKVARDLIQVVVPAAEFDGGITLFKPDFEGGEDADYILLRDFHAAGEALAW